jgi:hypothetical protein
VKSELLKLVTFVGSQRTIRSRGVSDHRSDAGGAQVFRLREKGGELIFEDTKHEVLKCLEGLAPGHSKGSYG